jgi:hypothetical protein
MAFGQLDQLSIRDKTAALTLYDIPGPVAEVTDDDGKTRREVQHPVLHMRAAGASNKAYQAAVLKRASKVRGNAKRQIDTAVERAREWDVDLFAKYVVTGWDHVYDEAGQPVPFSVERCEELLGKLLDVAPDILEEIRTFAGDASNFRDEIDADELAGN